jgi:hypothetical protein
MAERTANCQRAPNIGDELDRRRIALTPRGLDWKTSELTVGGFSVDSRSDNSRIMS